MPYTVHEEGANDTDITSFESMITNFTEGVDTITADPFMEEVKTYIIFTIAMGFRMCSTYKVGSPETPILRVWSK